MIILTEWLVISRRWIINANPVENLKIRFGRDRDPSIFADDSIFVVRSTIGKESEKEA